MKSFTSWVSDMAGTINDLSAINRKIPVSQTPLQVRYNFANLVLGKPLSRTCVRNWMRLFCSKNLASYDVDFTLGKEISNEYFMAEDDIVWWTQLETRILAGWVPSDIPTEET